MQGALLPDRVCKASQSQRTGVDDVAVSLDLAARGFSLTAEPAARGDVYDGAQQEGNAGISGPHVQSNRPFHQQHLHPFASPASLCQATQPWE